jgi:hypothetical protein
MDKEKLNQELALIQEDAEVVNELAFSSLASLIVKFALFFISMAKDFWISRVDDKLSKFLVDTMNEENVKKALVKLYLGKVISRNALKRGAKNPTDFRFTKDQFRVRIYPMDDTNAFVTGPGGRTVFLTQGLIDRYTKDEIKAILLHEMGHSFGGKSVHYLYAKLGTGVANEAFVKIIAKVIAKTFLKNIKDSPYLILLGGLKMAVEAAFDIKIDLFGTITQRTFGRAAETQADDFAVASGYGKQLVSAFKKMHKERVKCETKFCMLTRRISRMVDEHPPLADRIERAMNNPNIAKKKSPKEIVKILQKSK